MRNGMETLWIGTETGLKRRQRNHQLLGAIRRETVLVKLRSNVDTRLVIFISPTTYSLILIDYHHTCPIEYLCSAWEI
jgi:hypothetical protein